jgi:soluble P-type ATPase
MLALNIPGGPEIALEHLLLDANGTLTDRGELIDDAAPLVREIAGALIVHLVSADTFRTAEELARELDVTYVHAADGAAKRAYAEQLGADRCVVVGNGANDADVMDVAGLAIAIVGPEGASARAIQAADVVCGNIMDALSLLRDERALIATLRP